MDNVKVSVRVVGQCIMPNENGELEFESGAGTKTKIEATKVYERLLEAQSYEAALESLLGSGAYISSDNSRMIIVSTPNGVHIFSKDEPSRKITVDRIIPESTMQQILSINDFDEGRAVEKILVANGIIEEPNKDMEQIETFDRNNLSYENEADNVDSRNISDKGEIAAARLQRDLIEDPRSGIFSEEQIRNMEEERQRQIKEERARGREDGFSR